MVKQLVLWYPEIAAIEVQYPDLVGVLSVIGPDKSVAFVLIGPSGYYRVAARGRLHYRIHSSLGRAARFAQCTVGLRAWSMIDAAE